MEPTGHAAGPLVVAMGDYHSHMMRQSRLLQLPDELILEIAKYIERKRDLYNLSLSCRRFEGVIMRRLYELVDVEIPDSRGTSMAWPSSRFPTFRPAVLALMKELRIRYGSLEIKDTVYNKRRRCEVNTVDGYVCDLLEKIPPGQLRAFAFLHQSQLSLQMLELLGSRYRTSLKTLHLFETEDRLEHLDAQDPELEPKTKLPNCLRSLTCRSIRSGQTVGRLVEANKRTLETLHIGQEKELAEQYRRSRIGFLDQIAQPGNSFRIRTDLGTLPRLRNLTLVGLDLTPFIPRHVHAAHYFCNVESLTIESCAGAGELFETLTLMFQNAQEAEVVPQGLRLQPRLTSFSFRHEAFNNALKDALIRFLNCFHGLEKLSLLFENATLVERPSTMIANHGPTLTTLVLECRIQPREHLGLDTSRPLGTGGFTHQLWQESINDICDLCPNLVELGMGFPWDDEMVRLKKTKLIQLQQLRTIHVRNFPQSQVLSQLGDYAVQEHARRFIEWCFPSRVGGEKPGLETLAIGPTLYESRWKCDSLACSTQSTSNYRRLWNPPEYLRTHHYCLDWAKTRFGRWHAMITPVSERYVEDLRCERPLSGVFEQVWLR